MVLPNMIYNNLIKTLYNLTVSGKSESVFNHPHDVHWFGDQGRGDRKCISFHIIGGDCNVVSSVTENVFVC